jgi:hypothetical protein
LEEATKRDLDCEQPQKLTIAAVGATCSDPAYVVRSPPGVFARGAGLSLGSGVASALRNHHNVAVEALAALHYASGKVAYTSPSAFGEAFEPSQDWRDAWETLTETSNSKAENLEGLVHRSPNQFIREKVEPAVKAFSKGFKSVGKHKSEEALAQCTLKAARAAGEFVRNSLSKLYNLGFWTASWNPAACHVCKEALNIIDSSKSVLEQEAVLSFALVVGLAASAIDSVVLTDSPRQIIIEAEQALRDNTELLTPTADRDCAGVKEQARALVEVFAGKQPGSGGGSSSSGLNSPGEAIAILVPGPNLLVPKSKPAAKKAS